MKIGILTFHSQLNYGGVLQCWALQTALEKLGHDVIVFDRWLDPENKTLLGERICGIKPFVRHLRDLFNLNGVVATKTRRHKTESFIKKYLKLSEYHFYRWNEAPKVLGVDLIVVGSDQVWNSYGPKDPSVYLLKDAPPIKAIAYAASLGIRVIPAEKRQMYIDGFHRFAKISVREESARKLLTGICGAVDKVVDPVVLLAPEDWGCISCVNDANIPNGKLVCYFIAEQVIDCYKMLYRYAVKTKTQVEVYLGSAAQMRGLSIFCKLCSIAGGRIKLCVNCGPSEFLSSLRSADRVLTDSFHAVMFSMIFGKDVRVVKPKSEVRKAMFERIEELSDMLNDPNELIVEDFRSALASFEQGKVVSVINQKISHLRKDSLKWLKDAIKTAI